MATAEQIDALAALIGELNAASELTLGKRMVPGRTETGFYAALATTGEGRPLGPGGLPMGSKGGKRTRVRSLRGGALCDNSYVSLAIDSAIIMAGAGAIAGAGYTGFAALQYYMRVYGLDAAVVSVITALYEALRATLSQVLIAGVAVAASGATVASSAFSMASATGSAVAATTPNVFTTLATLAPPILFGRYYRTGLSAREDALAILNTLNGQYAVLTAYTGAVTRSMTEKKTELERQIAATRAAINETYQRAVEAGTGAVTATTTSYAVIKARICALIDNVNGGITSISDIFPGLESSEIIIAGGNNRRRTGKKRASRKNKTNKRHKRKSHRRRHH